MKDQEAIKMMELASAEIKQLRIVNDRLTPRAEAFDALQAVLNLMPQSSQGYGEYVAWMLDKRIRELKSADSEEVTKPLLPPTS